MPTFPFSRKLATCSVKNLVHTFITQRLEALSSFGHCSLFSFTSGLIPRHMQPHRLKQAEIHKQITSENFHYCCEDVPTLSHEHCFQVSFTHGFTQDKQALHKQALLPKSHSVLQNAFSRPFMLPRIIFSVFNRLLLSCQNLSYSSIGN